MPTGRPLEADNRYTSKYLDTPNTPLYPFGFGLSYTTFKLSNLRLSSRNIPKTGRLRFSVDIENTGGRDGTEVVQLYTHDLVASASRPVKELKGFQRVSLKAGEKRNLEISLDAKDLGFYNTANQYVVEPGKFDVMVGTSSTDGLRDSFSIIGNQVR
jgi:beta-glucosidase